MAAVSTSNPTELAEKLAQAAAGTQAQATAAVADPRKARVALMKDLVTKYRSQFLQVLPKHVDVDRLVRIVQSQLTQIPALAECDKITFLTAVMQCSQLGMEPGPLGQCYILPYKGKAQFILGYKGMIDLMRRSGNIESISVEVVNKNDYFKMEYGLNERLEHIPYCLREDGEFAEPGDWKGVYLVARFVGGGHYIRYMPKVEIMKHKERSQSANSSYSPWRTDEIEMAKKTIVRASFKWLPISVEVAKQLATDGTVKSELDPEHMEDVMPDFIEGEIIEDGATE